jgi:hypothetical protein
VPQHRRCGDPDYRIASVSNNRLGLGPPRPLAGPTVDQRLHHVVHLDTSGHGVSDQFSSPHGQILQSSLPLAISHASGRSTTHHDDSVQLIARLFQRTQSPDVARRSFAECSMQKEPAGSSAMRTTVVDRAHCD